MVFVLRTYVNDSKSLANISATRHFDCPLPEVVADEPTCTYRQTNVDLALSSEYFSVMIDKYVFTKECLEVFIQEALNTKPPTYATVRTKNTVIR